jgi:hypothetical protein
VELRQLADLQQRYALLKQEHELLKKPYGFVPRQGADLCLHRGCGAEGQSQARGAPDAHSGTTGADRSDLPHLPDQLWVTVCRGCVLRLARSLMARKTPAPCPSTTSRAGCDGRCASA